MRMDVKQITAKASLVLVGALPCTGQATTKPYAQMLVNETMLRNANLSSLSMVVPSPTTSENRVVASSSAAAIGNEADKSDLEVLAGNRPVTTPDVANHRCQAVVPLHDASGTTIGVLRIAFKSEADAGGECVRQAEALREELARVIPSAQVLFDPFIVASSSEDNLAQRLTIETLAKYPDVLVLAFHVTAPGETTNRVVGINQSKFFGRASDDVDQDIAKTGKMIVQMIPSTHRMEIHMPLRAADGSLVGTLVTVYLWRLETEAPALISRSMKIRDELQPRIPNLSALLSRGQPN